jgi:hypothetical protein
MNKCLQNQCIWQHHLALKFQQVLLESFLAENEMENVFLFNYSKTKVYVDHVLCKTGSLDSLPRILLTKVDVRRNDLIWFTLKYSQFLPVKIIL